MNNLTGLALNKPTIAVPVTEFDETVDSSVS